jgi:hypothetical protein
MTARRGCSPHHGTIASRPGSEVLPTQTLELLPVPAGDEASSLVQLLVDGVIGAYQDHDAPDTRRTYEEGWRDYLVCAEFLHSQGHDGRTLPLVTVDTADLGDC